MNGKYPNESFDLDIMMPPDIASIDSDISKRQSCFNYLNRQAKCDDTCSTSELPRSRLGKCA